MNKDLARYTKLAMSLSSLSQDAIESTPTPETAKTMVTLRALAKTLDMPTFCLIQLQGVKAFKEIQYLLETCNDTEIESLLSTITPTYNSDNWLYVLSRAATSTKIRLQPYSDTIVDILLSTQSPVDFEHALSAKLYTAPRDFIGKLLLHLPDAAFCAWMDIIDAHITANLLSWCDVLCLTPRETQASINLKQFLAAKLDPTAPVPTLPTLSAHAKLHLMSMTKTNPKNLIEARQIIQSA